jgi:hypothetical protein
VKVLLRATPAAIRDFRLLGPIRKTRDSHFKMPSFSKGAITTYFNVSEFHAAGSIGARTRDLLIPGRRSTTEPPRLVPDEKDKGDLRVSLRCMSSFFQIISLNLFLFFFLFNFFSGG